MKFCLIPLLLLFLHECKDESAKHSSQNCEQLVEIQEKGTVNVQCEKANDGTQSITITNLKIEDSRCCVKCNCFTAGFVKTFFTVSSSHSTKEVELTLGSLNGLKDQDSTIITLDNKKIILVLKEVYPIPQVPEDNEKDQTARLKVTHQ